ncbi:MAG: type I DNA topoisomerase [Gammaproteobacteria bacterium]|nr:type I DNA topoisomerase [Gammaproteobacteria bacterium]
MISLVIVESPAKAKTIKRYLGNDYEVLASYGHVRDLLPKEGAVDTEHNFEMRYQLIERNSKHVDAIVKSLRKADRLLLATDPDREGEAISWHLLEILKKKRGLMKEKEVGRVVFHEVTKKAIREAVEHPRQISTELVNAQQARRALDYLVGFNLSPLLWKKIRRGLSAGRVQSPALRMIVEREEAIERFQAQEYWTLEAEVTTRGENFSARLSHLDGKKLDKFAIGDGEEAHRVEARILREAEGRLTVVKVEKKSKKRNPAPPFTTSTLQQEASRKLGFNSQRTMRTAQQLYEGIDIGGETTGLITYMRTDSVTLSDEALEEIRRYVGQHFGDNNLPKAPRIFKTKSKNAQEAHEAIRTTSAFRPPNSLQDHLSKDQFRLYELIWKRSLASQMIHATLDTVAVDLAAAEGDLFRASGSVIVDPGFMALYQEGSDQKKSDSDQENSGLLPPLHQGERVELIQLLPEQHFTEPPPRFSEASLVKTLEEFGIGRPSTYASIISTLQQREYVEMDKRRFIPTDVGRVVNKFLTAHFNRYVDYDFTANLEDQLDAVSRGEEEWLPLLEKFWRPFKSLVTEKEESVSRKEVTEEAMDESCPECGKPLVTKLGKRGRFVACTGYPDCSYTRNLDGDSDKKSEPEVVEGRSCPQCQAPLYIREGRYGKFIGCSAYPSCKFIESIEQPLDTGVSCPKCSQGSILRRKSRRGKIFFSCSTYPKCDYALWDEPVAEACPECSWPILSIKTTKRRGTEKVCPQKECSYAIPFTPEGGDTEEEGDG